jgi:hypothetical protein
LSWSVASSGKAPAVAADLTVQIGKLSFADAGETETVQKTGELIAQTLGTFDPEKLVSVSASGHLGFADWGAKIGPYQNVKIEIVPIHLSVSG